MTQLPVPPATQRRARAAGHGWLAFAGTMFLIGAAANALWTVLVLVIDGLIIYGLLVHGADPTPD